jgi:hypothetical protein
MMVIAGVLCLTTERMLETGEFIFQRMDTPAIQRILPPDWVTDQTLLIVRSLKKAKTRITSQPMSNSHHFIESLAEPGRA